ncbi:MAG TPA: nucleotidyl transferase AbiEii/AbiGii toxin family protein [Niabella sp.]|nr:nucleotidyl transferase AbiEii/AbiGii toxin family protein [Niabella sp.]HUN02714.1 nucleotidyl transferase AbiEii/AbiGii toxin family protein [Niabella sp.]
MKILQKEIQQFAEQLEVPANTIDKDYVIGHFLNELFTQTWAQERFLFKGGTCLKKCYFDTYRFSEDIDLTITDKDFKLTKDHIESVCNNISGRTDVLFNLLTFEEVFFKDNFVGWDIKICFWGANHRRNEVPVFREHCHTFIESDARNHEIQLLESESRDIIHPYSDRQLITTQVPCYSIHEILSEKMRSLIQRNRGEARDYYDLWYIKNNIAAIDWNIVKEVFTEKCSFKNIPFQSPDDFFKEARIAQAKTN